MQACHYHGHVQATHFALQYNHGHIYAIKNSNDVKKLISPYDLEKLPILKSLQERNVFFIYNQPFNCKNDYFLSEIQATAAKIIIIITKLTQPFTLENNKWRSQFYVISTPKHISEENITVSSQELDIYAQAEFKGFKKFDNFDKIDNNIAKEFHNFDASTQETIKTAAIQYLTATQLLSLGWYKSLTSRQKITVVKLREELIFLAERKKLSLEEIQALEKNCFSRYDQLCDRLSIPVIKNS